METPREIIRCPVCKRLKTSSIPKNPKAPPWRTDWAATPSCFNLGDGFKFTDETCPQCQAEMKALAE